jgi:enoyl-CoA hydratase
MLDRPMGAAEEAERKPVASRRAVTTLMTEALKTATAIAKMPPMVMAEMVNAAFELASTTGVVTERRLFQIPGPLLTRPSSMAAFRKKREGTGAR